MSYATISTWKGQRSPDDDMIATLNSKYAPALKAMGATDAYFIQTGELESAVVTIWPDEATCNTATAKIAEIRSQAPDDFSNEMTGELKGPIIASA
jgi:hypothetical protein